MSNHIKIKLLDFVFANVTQELFNSKIDNIVEKLRKSFPRNKKQSLHAGLQISINFNSTPDQESAANNLVLLMLDADGLYGIKIHSSGIKLSTSKYVRFENLLETFKTVADVVVSVLDISHYSTISLRNINLFDNKAQNEFFDIKDSSIWGTQNFDVLGKGDFVCGGAATRHEYLSKDETLTLNISSGVLFPEHSYIPREEWDIWNYRGNIPTIELDKEVQLIIDIFGTHYSTQLSKGKQNDVAQYKWENIKSKLIRTHELINNVYQEIAED